MSSYDGTIPFQWWLFDTNPYAVDALRLDEDSLKDEVTAPAPEPPAAYQPSLPLEMLLSERHPATDGSAAKPFILEPVNGYDVGMVRAQTMADFIEAKADWVDATKTATITGVDRYGQPLEIVLVQGQYTATINGNTVDIAAYSGSASPGTATVLNKYDALYLPARFIIQAYGGRAIWDDIAKTATFYKY
jgi:hypothetical protein